MTQLPFPRELSPSRQVPDSPGCPAPEPQIPHIRWGAQDCCGGRHPTRGPSPRRESDPAPLSPLLPWALTFGLLCSSLHCLGLSGILPGLFSCNPPPCVSDGLLAARHPAAGVRSPGLPSARLWGGWFDQNPARWCFRLVIATHCPHPLIACKFPSLGCAECPISSAIARPPDVGASGIISSLIGVMGDQVLNKCWHSTSRSPQGSLWTPVGFLSFSRGRVLGLWTKRLLCRRGLISPRKVGRLGPEPER